MKRTFYFIAVLALGITACNKNQIQTPAEEPAAPGTEAPVYHFSIPASIGGEADTKAVTLGESSITSTFLTTDEIGIYNVTKNAWARKSDHIYAGFATLHPSDIKNEGKSCTLSGDLSFYTYDPSKYEWTPVEIEQSDTYNLYYNAIENQINNSGNVKFKYGGQNGTKDTDHDDGYGGFLDYGSSHCDYALAEGVTMSLSGSTLLTLDGSVKFVRYGSLFRQRLASFTKGGKPVSPAPTSFKILTISTEHKILVIENSIWDINGAMIVKDDHIQIDGTPSVMDANGDIYFALAFDNTEIQAGDKLYFEVEGYDGNRYRGEKEIPAGGLQDGKYYYGNLDMVWTSQRAIPTVTASDASPILPTEYDSFEFGDGATISGNSDGFVFYMTGGGSVTLTGSGTATAKTSGGLFGGGNPILSCESDKNMTIILDSDYAFIHNSDEEVAIWTNGSGNLYLKTTGGTHTLTIKAKGSEFRGLYGDNYWSESGVGELAADANTTVTLSDTDNHDGTHTYVYTVTTTNP